MGTPSMVEAEGTQGRIQLIRDLSNELAAFFYTLPDDVWRDADQFGTPCEDWKVADVVTHLIQVGDMFFQSVTRALDGDTTPPMAYSIPTPEESLVQLVELRDAYFEDLFYEFNTGCRRLNSLLVSLDSEQYDNPAWHPAGAVPVNQLITWRTFELAVHGWDVRYSFDRSARLNAGALPFLVDNLWSWLRSDSKATAELDAPVSYRFELEGPETASYDVAFSGEGFIAGPSEDRKADVTFRCDTDTYVLFVLGRLPFNRSVRRGRLSFEGDEALASRFTSWFRPV